MTMPGSRTRARLGAAAVVAFIVPVLLLSSSSASTPQFGGAVRMPGGSVSEPGIDVGPDGTIFVNGIQGLPSHSKAWRSTDGASTFQQLAFGSPYSRYPGGGDSDVVVGDGGRVYFLDLSAVSNSLARSEDNGSTWVDGTPFTTLPLSDRQWIALGERDPSTGKDTVYVNYHFIQPPQNIMFARSRDGGTTWDWHTVPSGTGGALPGQLVSDGDFVAYNYATASGVMYLVRSFDAGTTWTSHRVSITSDVAGSLSAVAMDGNAMYIAWINRLDWSVRVSRSLDRGETWELFPLEVSTDGSSSMFPWIAARDGKVAVTWYGADDWAGDPNAAPGIASWRIKYAETFDYDLGFTAPVNATSIAKRGRICTEGLNCTSGRELGDFHQVAIDLQGKSLIAYVDIQCDTGVGGQECGGANVVKQVS